MNWFNNIKIATNVPYVRNYDWDSDHRNWLWLGIGYYHYLYKDVDFNTYEELKNLRERYFNGPKKYKRNLLRRLFQIVKEIEPKRVKPEPFKKIAAPVMEESRDLNYIDIGHDLYLRDKNTGNIVAKNKIYLWVIDENFDFYKTEASKETYHEKWFYSKGGPLENTKELAFGRYDGEKHIVSVYPNYDFMRRHKSETEQRIIENKINEILDYQFDNPTIRWFG